MTNKVNNDTKFTDMWCHLLKFSELAIMLNITRKYNIIRI